MVASASDIQGWWQELWAPEGQGAPLAQGACHCGLGPGAGLWAVPELTVGALSLSLFSRCRLGHLAAVLPGGGGEPRGATEGGKTSLVGSGGRLLPFPAACPPAVGMPRGFVQWEPLRPGGPERDDGTPGPVSPFPPPALTQALPNSQDDYIKSWEDNQPGDEGTAEMGLGRGTVGSVPASRGGRGIALPACTPRAFPFRPGAAVGSVRAGKQQLVPRRLPSCSLNGALCRAGWWPALPGLPWGVPAGPSPSLPPSPGHHQGPLPEGEVQPAQGVRGAGLPARHVHQPQEAGAQVGARRRRGRAAAGGKGARGGGSAPSRPCQDQAAGPQGARGLQALPRRPGGCRLRLRRPHLQLGGKDSGTRRGDGALCPVPPRRRPAAAPQCKLEQQACLANKQLTVRCEGQCPCPTPHSPAGDSKQGEWSARHRGTVPELCPA